MNTSNKALAAFLTESQEGLEKMERDLVELEKSPGDHDKIQAVFRVIHTLKGTCGFFGFSDLERVGHAAENLLAQLRSGALHLDMPIISALLDTIDALRVSLKAIEQTGEDRAGTHQALMAQLDALAGQADASANTASTGTVSEPPAMAGQAEPTMRTGSGNASTHDADNQTKSADQAPATENPATEKQAATASDAGLAEHFVRVDVALLDKLMNQVGELVLVRNQLLQYVAAHADTPVSGSVQRLNLVTSEIQEGLMQTRMQPVNTIWGSYPRLVRDLEVHTGKQVQLTCQGGNTELDRSLLQAIKDPLTHLLRNAIDHGLESPEQRTACGKPPQGHIVLRAFHESGNVIIEILDDGAGIDRQSVIKQALAAGVLSAREADTLTDRDVWSLLFMPGFSTAHTVTALSGRGVGLDVVKDNIEHIGGSVDVQSWAGKGTSFKLKIPLTLAIVPALITSCHQERFAIPQVNLLEIVHIDTEQDSRRKIEYIQQQPVFRLRGHVLPLVDLGQLLGYAAPCDDRAPGEAGAATHQQAFILVLKADQQQFGLIVDMLHDTEEIVVKPLDKHLKSVPLFAGGTVMGDGHVALILDVRAIAHYADLLHRKQAAQVQPAAAHADTEDTQRSFLLFALDGGRSQGAIPLSSVARLEKFPRTDIEFARGEQVIQYRGRILPLLHLGDLLELDALQDQDELQVIVHDSGQGHVGFIVDHILDVVKDVVDTEGDDWQGRKVCPGVKGSAVVHGRVTDLIDMDALLSRYGAASRVGASVPGRAQQEPVSRSPS